MTDSTMTGRQYALLQTELAELRVRHDADAHGGLAGAGPNRLGRHSVRELRIREIQDLLDRAVIGDEPMDAPVARPGMVLTIRYDGTGETETFILGRAGADGTDIKTYSLVSPMGGAIAGAGPGDQRIYSAPSRPARVVTLLRAVPHDVYRPGAAGPQPVH